VVVDPKQAVNALRWAVKEMEERVQEARGGRRPQHRAVQPQRGTMRPRKRHHESARLMLPLPYIVVSSTSSPI
jgi:DNA segregation ATPase FtsK/SpoIIIE-like protein